MNKEWYVYDGYGRRVIACGSAACNYQLYSQLGQLLYTQDARKGINTDYIYLAGSVVATHARPAAGGAESVTYQHTDALGSPVATTNAAGQVVERTQYEPYGAAIGKTVDGVGYTGHAMDKEQKAMNERGGKENLDNKRNEVAPEKWKDRNIIPPNK